MSAALAKALATKQPLAVAAAVALAIALVAARALPPAPAPWRAGTVPVFALSLARHTRRRDRLAAQAAGVQFVDAVDGATLPRAAGGLTRGERGCFLGHAGLWRRVVEGVDPVALILEDDANVRLPDQWRAIRAAAGAAPPGWDVLYLGHNNQAGPAGVRAASGDVWGNHAMLLTRRGAAKLLARYRLTGMRRRPGAGPDLPVDVWMSRVPGLRRYCVLPSMVDPFDLADSETQRTR